VSFGVSWNEAAAIPLAGLTALQALRDCANLKPGQNVLINGASGGVGHFAVQIARNLGATVTAVCSERNLHFVTELGANYAIDYQQTPHRRSTGPSTAFLMPLAITAPMTSVTALGPAVST